MTQRDLVTVVGGVVVGVIGSMVVGTTVFGVSFFGGRDTPVRLIAAADGSCTLEKETDVWAKAGKDLTWTIKNYCLVDGTVSVGDFRLTADQAALDCSQPGGAYPFKSGRPSADVPAGKQRGDGTIDPGSKNMTLKIKSHADATDGITRYYFNICLNGAPKDPLLLVER